MRYDVERLCFPKGPVSHHRTKARRTFCQTGFLSVSVLLLLTVLGVLTVTIGNYWHREYRAMQGHLLGAELAQLNEVVQEFVTRYPLQIKRLSQSNHIIKIGEGSHAVSIHTVPVDNALRPTWEIEHDGFTKMANALLKIKGAPKATDYALQVSFATLGNPLAGGCENASARDCSIETLLYRKTAVPDYLGIPDPIQMQAALRALGPGGASSLTVRSTDLMFGPTQSRDEQYAFPNPVPNNPAGILAIRGLFANQHHPYLNVTTGEM